MKTRVLSLSLLLGCASAAPAPVAPTAAPEQSEAEQIVRAVRATGRPVWYLLALNEGHGFQKKENRDYGTLATALFLREHLAAPR